MGGFGAEQIVQTIIGVGGTAASIYGATSQAKSMNQMIGQGRGTVALQEGLAKYFLGGGKASRLDIPGFQDQFGEIDFALQEQERLIDDQSKDAQQMIADNIPPGGAKLRALANLAIKTQDAKGKAVRESQSRKRDLDVQLTNQYTQAAMGAKYGPSQDARLWTTQRDYENMVRNYGAISGTLGQMTTEAFRSGGEEPRISYDPYTAGGTPMPYQDQYAQGLSFVGGRQPGAVAGPTEPANVWNPNKPSLLKKKINPWDIG